MNQALIDAYRWHRQHNSTNEPAWRDIARARVDVAANRKRYPSNGKAYGGAWQCLEAMRPRADLYTRAYFCDDWPDGWRNLGNVGKIRSEYHLLIDHTGWYTEDDGGETIAGYVLQLPARNGKPIYIPGTANSGCDGVTLYPLDQYDDMPECARAAGRYAEIEAEHERDYQRAWRVGRNAEDCEERAKEIRKEILLICSDLRIARMAGYPAGEPYHANADSMTRLCDIVRGKVQSLLTDLYAERAKRNELRSDYGTQDGFNDA